MWRSLGLSCAAILSLVSLASAAPISITTATGSNGADSFVRLAQPDTNFGGSEFVRIQNNTTTARKTYLRFDLSSLTTPVTGATLLLTPNNDFAGATFNLYGLNDLHAGEAWGEGAITYNNAPANHATPGTVDAAQATLLGSFAFASFTEGVAISFSTSAIRDFVNADTNNLLTFILTRPGTGTTNYDFASKENTEAYDFPTLQLVTAVPEPSTFAMLGTIAISLIGYRGLKRRRA